MCGRAVQVTHRPQSHDEKHDQKKEPAHGTFAASRSHVCATYLQAVVWLIFSSHFLLRLLRHLKKSYLGTPVI